MRSSLRHRKLLGLSRMTVFAGRLTGRMHEPPTELHWCKDRYLRNCRRHIDLADITHLLISCDLLDFRHLVSCLGVEAAMDNDFKCGIF